MHKTVKIGTGDGFTIFGHFHEEQSSILVVTFGDIKSTLAPSGFGTEWMLKQGWDTVYVAQGRRTQYQRLSRETFSQLVSPIAERYKRVVCYGASLGGYCALYFGGALNSHIVAASPRLSNHPIVNAPRFKEIPLLHDKELPVPLSPTPPVVIFDPLILKDSRFLFQYAGPQYEKIYLCPLPGAGHHVLKKMAEAGVLSKVMNRIISGKINSLPKWAVEKINQKLQ